MRISTLYLFMLFFIGACRSVQQVSLNSAPVINQIVVNEELQGQQGVVQKIIRGFAHDDGDAHQLRYKYRILSGNATLEQVNNIAILYPNDEKEIVIQLSVTDNHGATTVKTLSYKDIEIDPKKLYTDKANWMEAIGDSYKNHPSFIFQQRNEALPNVLIIGNSISVGYTPYAQEELKGKCNVYRIPENGGDTNKCLKKLDFWLGDNNWDVIHFNFGLHDLKRIKNNQLDITGKVVNTKYVYAQNLEEIVKRLKEASDAKLIWASISVIPKGADGRIKGTEVEYNQIAEKIMNHHGINIDDQYKLTLSHPDEQIEANVHFHKKGSKRQAKQVVASILESLKQ